MQHPQSGAPQEGQREPPFGPPLDRMEVGELLAAIHAEDLKVAPAVGAILPAVAKVVEQAVGCLERGGRLRYFGTGSSGRLGVLDAAECPPTFGVEPQMVAGVMAGGSRAFGEALEGAEDDRLAGCRAVAGEGVGANDLVLAVSASGTTPWCLGVLEEAGRRGAVRVALTCAGESPLGRLSEYPLVVDVGPEVIAGSTRLKAGTAQKMVLNMISTAVMVRRGLTLGNLMVGVRPQNAKLRARARRLVATILGREEGVLELLEEAAFDVRVAVLMGQRGLGAAESRSLLAAFGGRLRQALESS